MLFKHENDFNAAFRSASQKHGVSYALLKAVAGSESAFNPLDILYEPSHSRTKQPGDTDASRGIMQVTEDSARVTGWPANTSYERLSDPAIGIDYGAAELKRYLDNPHRNEGPISKGRAAVGGSRVADAVAAYNMGYPRAIQFTTPNIAALNGYTMADVPRLIQAGWMYANQRYVTSIIMSMVYFDALDRNDLDTAARVEADINSGKALGVYRLLCVSLSYPSADWQQQVLQFGLSSSGSAAPSGGTGK